MSDEHTIAIVNFQGALKREIMKVKSELVKCDDISEFRIDIECSGRVHEGDIKVEYKLGTNYGTKQVEGRDLKAIVEEFIRRYSWTKRNAPLMLTVSEQKAAEPDSMNINPNDELPF